MSREHYAEACQKFAESQRLDPGGGTLLNLALCHEKEGKIATAWADFREALGDARRDRRREREKLAKEHIEALEPRLPRLIVQVMGVAADHGVEVTLDGTVIAASAWGTPIPVDPGEHMVEAQEQGKKKWSGAVTAREREQTTIVVPSLEGERADGSSVAVGTPHPGTPSVSNSRRKGAYVAGSVGLLAIGIGTYFGISAIHERQQADQGGCGPDTCSDRDAAAHNDNAVTQAWITDAAFGVGLVAAGLATYWFVTSSATQPSGTAARSPSRSLSAFPLAVAPLRDRSGGVATWQSSF
jgi:hypothetical protein